MNTDGTDTGQSPFDLFNLLNRSCVPTKLHSNSPTCLQAARICREAYGVVRSACWRIWEESGERKAGASSTHSKRFARFGCGCAALRLSAFLFILVLMPSLTSAAALELTIDSSKGGEEIELTRYYPAPGRYHWDTLDTVIEKILETKAKPILCLCFKPKALYPKIDQHVVHPSDYAEWEELVYQLVKHCNQARKFGIEYWEVANEPDIGEDGGCPYLFQPADYVIYYAHTVSAIRRADPRAKVGGPALAGYNSDIGTALIEHCGKGQAPLDFFSWHVYHSDPGYFRKSIRDAN